jgi:hypothetical protein
MDNRSQYLEGAFIGDVTILAAASLSDELVLDYARIVNIKVGEWTDDASITFQAIAVPGDTYQDVFDELGVEVEIPSDDHDRMYSVPDLAGFFAIKIRSGDSAVPVVQTDEETITVFGRR